MKHRLLEIRHDYGQIDEGEYAKAKAELITDEAEREVAYVHAKIKCGEMTEIDGEREIANIRDEPWIRVINDGIDLEQGIDGYFFEFDWNDQWVAALREAGYVGPTEETIVQAWFQDVCRMEASASMGTPPINGGLIVG